MSAPIIIVIGLFLRRHGSSESVVMSVRDTRTAPCDRSGTERRIHLQLRPGTGLPSPGYEGHPGGLQGVSIVRFACPAFPVRPSDDINRVYRIDPEDCEDLVMDIAHRADVASQTTNEIPTTTGFQRDLRPHRIPVCVILSPCPMIS